MYNPHNNFFFLQSCRSFDPPELRTGVLGNPPVEVLDPVAPLPPWYQDKRRASRPKSGIPLQRKASDGGVTGLKT